jgi:hypothetical protein
VETNFMAATIQRYKEETAQKRNDALKKVAQNQSNGNQYWQI